MRKMILLHVLLFLLGSCLFACDSNTNKSKLTQLIEDGAVLLDVRTHSEFKEDSVPGSINIPLDELSGRVKELQKNRPIIVFCKSGNRSAKAVKILEQNQISNVTNGGSWLNVKAAKKKVKENNKAS